MKILKKNWENGQKVSVLLNFRENLHVPETKGTLKSAVSKLQANMAVQGIFGGIQRL